ncbi:MAG: DDE-type integrase/transposase/recombinase [Sweet potato little leaf phytoplasma]|nr:DDE-type integrase/transposase/recombinase [Sweet potato little leaf phytoplasma]
MSRDGYKYYISFVDDFTRLTHIFPLKAKSDAFKTFCQYKILVENRFEKKIKILQTDWGGEFRSFTSFLQANGIEFRHPCPHTSQQNGVVERKHRHIVEMGLTLLAHASMPLAYWWDAFSSAVYIINRLPTPTLGDISPWEFN